MAKKSTKKDSVVVSALPMLAECPRFESGPVGEAAEFGSLFHNAVEVRDLDMLTNQAAVEFAELMNWTQSDVVDAYTWALDFEDTLIEKYQPVVCEREAVGQLSLIPGRRLKIDVFMMVSPTEAIVIDWKTGRKNYDAATNAQGWGYVVALFEQCETLQEVSMVFASPFIKSYDWHTFNRDDYEGVRNKVESIVARAKNKRTHPKVCDFCSWCHKTDSCKAVAKSLKEVVAYGVDTGLVKQQPKINFSLEEAKKDPEKMSQLRDMVPFLEKMAKAIKEAANSMRFDEGIEIPGYSVTSRRSQRRVVKDETKAIILRLSEKYQLDVRELLPYLNIDVKNLEGAVGDSVEPGRKTEAISSFMQECTASGWVTGGGDEGSPFLLKSKKKTD